MSSISIDRFWHGIENTAFSETNTSSYEEQMRIIEVVAYSDAMKLEEVDFSSFSLSNAKHAFEDIMAYVPEEGLDMAEDDDEDPNRDSLLTEINRIAHFSHLVDRQVRKCVKKRTFV